VGGTKKTGERQRYLRIFLGGHFKRLVTTGKLAKSDTCQSSVFGFFFRSKNSFPFSNFLQRERERVGGCGESCLPWRVQWRFGGTTGLNILAPAEHQPTTTTTTTKSKNTVNRKILSMKITTGKIPHHIFVL